MPFLTQLGLEPRPPTWEVKALPLHQFKVLQLTLGENTKGVERAKIRWDFQIQADKMWTDIQPQNPEEGGVDGCNKTSRDSNVTKETRESSKSSKC